MLLINLFFAGQEKDPADLILLHDIVTLPPVSWWPPTPAWFVLGALVFFVAVLGAWHGFRRRRANAYRRAALQELETMSEVRRLPALLKRTALAAWPREEVAGLSGRAWLDFLDRSAGMKEFTQGAGRILPDLAYGNPDTPAEEDLSTLTRLAERWIREHRVLDKG